MTIEKVEKIGFKFRKLVKLLFVNIPRNLVEEKSLSLGNRKLTQLIENLRAIIDLPSDRMAIGEYED